MAQFNFPCEGAVGCPSVDSAVLNLSSETPEAIRYFGFKFFGDQWGLCITTSPELAALCDLPFPTNPPALVLSSSTPQTCTVPCDGIPVSYTAVAGSFVAATQADADIQAYALACVIAQIICDGGTVTVFTNTAQSCTVPCPTGGSMTITMPIGVASGITQIQANQAALALACVVADFLCNQSPISEGIPPFGGAGSGPSSFTFKNSEQSCSFPCPDGQSIFTHTIPGGLFYGSSPAAANAVAQSFACNRSLVTPACLDNIVTDLCLEQPYADIIGVTGFTEATMSIVDGFLPLGLFFSNGIISGSPLETGQFPFTVRATQGSDYMDRTYTFNVRAITTVNLPSEPVGTPYNEVLASTGFSSAAVWSIVSGVLPPGLALQVFTGVISGTLNTEGVYPFTVGLTEGSSTCTQDYTITVTSNVDYEYWNYEELSGNRLDAIHSAPMVPFTVNSGAVNRVAGKVNFGVQLLVGAFGLVRLQQTLGTGFPFAIASGITMCGWVKIDTIAVDGMDFGFVGTNSPHGFQCDLGFLEVSGNWYLFDAVASTFAIVTPPPMGAWAFFVLEVLPDSTLQIEWNRSGTPEGTIVTTPPEGNGFTLVMEMADLTEGDWSFDEIGFFPFILSNAAKDYLYNGGNGRGTPIVLPP